MSQGQRKLAAIMFTDMVGYTALSEQNEAHALQLLEDHRGVIRPFFSKHNGQEIKTIGDGFLVEFASALEAVRCAFNIQETIHELNLARSAEKRFSLRIGVHLGDVIHSKNDVYGDAVNIASRIEALADAGGICITAQVHDHVKNKFEVPLESLGIRSLKNVSEPVEVYKMVLPWEKVQDRPTRLETTRIAVLPFANMSPDPNDSYFADGITEEIISTLSGISGLSVISRTSVMGYKGTTKKVKEIGNELEAGSVLEGSFRKAGNKIRVTTQLITVEKDQHVWSQSYDRNLDDVFAVQTDIAKEVSDALRVRILAPEINRIERKPTENTKAFTLYLRGRYHWNKRGIVDLTKATEYFVQAVEEDPKFALGYSGLADCYEIIAGNWGIERDTNHDKAKVAIAKALELDEDLAEAHATLGLILLNDFKFREAEEEFKKAIQLKPSYASAHHWYYNLLRAELRWDEALRRIEKAVELDPFSQIIKLNHASYYYDFKREYVKALELTKKAVELDPDNAGPHFVLSETYGRLKMFGDARRETDIGLELRKMPLPTGRKRAEAMLAYLEDDRERVRRLLGELEPHLGEHLIDAGWLAGLHFYLGEVEKGFELLEKSYSRKEFFLLFLNVDPFFDRVRADPRYQKLLIRLGL